MCPLQPTQDALVAEVRAAVKSLLRGASWSPEPLAQQGERHFAALMASPPEAWEPDGLLAADRGARLGAVHVSLDLLGLFTAAGESVLAARWRERATELAAGTKLGALVERSGSNPEGFLQAQRLAWMVVAGVSEDTLAAAEEAFLASQRDPILLRYGLGS